MPNDRILSIDLVKIIAMYMVLMLHLGVHRNLCTDFDYSPKPFLYSISGIAVPLFFMVSGYLLSGRTITYKYVLKKIWGIIRLCLLVCVLWNIINYIRFDAFYWDFPLCFIQQGRFGHFWYFGAMMILYMLMPGILNVLKKNAVVWLSLLGIVCFLMFVMDYLYGIEKDYIIQTFRVWYWVFYFSLGVYIRLNPNVVQRVKCWHLILAMVLYVSSVQLLNTKGIEFHFGDITCIAYATSAFCMCLKIRQFRSEAVIKVLSQCFLPIYALHEILLGMLVYHEPFISIDGFLPSWVDFGVEYILACLSISLIAVGIMKIPYSDRLFRI